MSQPSLGIILQARMGSTRLPGKILLPIGGRPLLEHVFERAALLRAPAKLVVATSTLPGDDAVERFCRERGVACFRGDEADVLERYRACAQEHGFGLVIRLTGDNPFTDVEELDRLVELRREKDAAFAHSFERLPIGVGAEIFTSASLEESARLGHAPHHREHVDEYLIENPGQFTTVKLSIPASKNRPDLRLTVDTEADRLRATFIVEHARSSPVETVEAIRLAGDYARAVR